MGSAPPAPVSQSRSRYEQFRAGKARRRQVAATPKAPAKVTSKPKVRSLKRKPSLEEIRHPRSMRTLEHIEFRTSKPKARTVKSPKGGRPAAKGKTRSKVSNPTRVTRMSDRMATTMD